MPWEGAAKRSVKLPFPSYATTSPQLRVSWCTPALQPWSHTPACRVTHVSSLPHTRKRVPRPRPVRLSSQPLLPPGGTVHGMASAWGLRAGTWASSQAAWNASFGGLGTGSGPLSGPWYSTHKVSAHRAAPWWGPGTRGLGERGVLISASSLCPLKSPIPAPVCCWLCSLFTPLFSLHCLASPSEQSFLSRNWAELCCSVLEHHWFLSPVFLLLSVLTMDLGNCKREAEAVPEN